MASAAYPTARRPRWCWPVTEREGAPFGDPLSAPFWEAAARRELVVQRCRRCETRQFFARPFCLACDATDLDWVAVAGLGTIYSMTTVRRQASADYPVPYINALVDLDEGPRVLTTIVGGLCAIGDRVRVMWKDRPSMPPLPVFTPIRSDA
jgi:uncharacterized OB-fold protein